MAWCERAFALLPPAPPAGTPVDLLVLQLPNNPHTVGPRFAARVLAARGFSVTAYEAPLPFEEVVALAHELRPRFIGFSCDVLATVPLATEMVRRLRERLLPQTPSGYVLSGHAFRVGAGVSAPPPPGVSVVRTIDEFVALAGARA